MAAEGARLHGGPDALGVPAHDFSTNANACGPCPQALAAVRQADAARYPDPAYTALREALAAFHRVDAERVLPAASASEFIWRISAWTAREAPGAAVWLPAHAFGDCEAAARAWRLEPRRSPAPLGDARLAWCCDPSAPLGQPQADLPARVGAAAAAGAACVLDLAYEPLRLAGRLALDPAACDKAWQLWSPNKALGLTGVRAAYAIAPHGAGEAACALAALAPSWPLGAHGSVMLSAWTQPAVQQWLADSREVLRVWKARQAIRLRALGWTVLPSDANYFCARPDGPEIDARLAALRTAGIKLRDTTSFGLPGHVRLGVLPPASQDALCAAWRAGA